MKRWAMAAALMGAAPIAASAQGSAAQCASCEQWNIGQDPFRVFGNTYYVGARELSSILIASDSLTAVPADSYRYTNHPELLRRFYKSFATLEALPCDILLSAHPGFSHTLQKRDARDGEGHLGIIFERTRLRTY